MMNELHTLILDCIRTHPAFSGPPPSESSPSLAESHIAHPLSPDHDWRGRGRQWACENTVGAAMLVESLSRKLTTGGCLRSPLNSELGGLAIAILLSVKARTSNAADLRPTLVNDADPRGGGFCYSMQSCPKPTVC